MKLSCILNIEQDIVQIYYNKNIKPFSKNLVNIALKTGGYIGEVEGYYLVLKMAISGTKSRLLFVTFLNPHLMIGMSQVQLDKPLSPA